MGKPVTVEATNPFGEWLETIMADHGMNRKMLADRAGVGTTTVSNWIAGLRSPKRDTIMQIVNGVSQDPEIAAELLNAGLKAAGFSGTETMPIEYAPILDELRSASYAGSLDSGDVDEITEIIRMKHRRKAEREGRA